MDGAAVALVEVVEDDDLLAAGDELFDDDAADVPGAAGDENFHGWGSLLTLNRSGTVSDRAPLILPAIRRTVGDRPERA